MQLTIKAKLLLVLVGLMLMLTATAAVAWVGLASPADGFLSMSRWLQILLIPPSLAAVLAGGWATVAILRQAGLTNEPLQDENRQQRAWLERLLDELPVGITIFDRQQRLIVRNSAMNRLHPHPDPKRLIGVSIDALIHEVLAASGLPPADQGSFVRDLAARYQSSREGRFEARFPGGAEVSVYFRWIDDKYLVLVHTDISALREAERRATQAEQRMRSIVESLPLGLVLYDETERRVLVNKWIATELPGAREHVGPLRHEEIMRNVPPDEITTADGRSARGQAAVDLMISTYRSQPRGVMAMRRGDRSFAVHFANLPGIGRVVAATNVTDLVQAQRAAQESERLLRAAISEIPISFALFAPDGTLRLFNEEFRREFRTIADTIRTGTTAREIVAAYFDASDRPPPRFGGNEEEWRRARQDRGQREFYLEKLTLTFLHGPADPLDVERDYGTYRLRRVTLPNGDMVRVSADITDLREKEAKIRRLGESALAQRTATLQEIIDTIPQAVAVLGSDREVRFVNRSLSDLIGGPGRGEPSRRLAEIFAALGVPQSSVDDLFAGGPREFEVVSRDQRPLRIRATAIPTGDTLITISDLTEQRRAEAERLEQQQRVLEAEKSQAVLTLAGTIAHDFNNLLAVILGFSSIASAASKKVLDMSALPPADARELADVVSSIDKVVVSAERGRNVVASLNALSQERRAHVERLDLRTVVKDVEQLLRVLVPSSIRFDLDLIRSPCMVIANATQIEQIVTNLCVNAVHALEGKAGQVSISVDMVDLDGGRAEGLRTTEAAVHRGASHVEVAADGSVSMFVGVLPKGRYARLRVVDNGHGMTEDVARKIFTPFFTTKAPGSGTGLGLSSVIEIVASHDGGIHVRTKPRTGAAFMVLFPLADAAVEAETVAPGGASKPAERTPGADIRTETRILVIDDEALLAELAANVLRRAGYEVEDFTDPAAALGRFRSDPMAFDLIMTDQTMPGMTGLELVERIRPLRPDVPIIICTGHVPEIEKSRVLPSAIRHVLRKPYSPIDLTTSVREALAQPLPAIG